MRSEKSVNMVSQFKHNRGMIKIYQIDPNRRKGEDNDGKRSFF